jgi:hypothetical protein
VTGVGHPVAPADRVRVRLIDAAPARLHALTVDHRLVVSDFGSRVPSMLRRRNRKCATSRNFWTIWGFACAYGAAQEGTRATHPGVRQKASSRTAEPSEGASRCCAPDVRELSAVPKSRKLDQRPFGREGLTAEARIAGRSACIRARKLS